MLEKNETHDYFDSKNIKHLAKNKREKFTHRTFPFYQ